MSRCSAVVASIFSFLSLANFAVGQDPPASDPQALTYAAQSITAMTGGTTVSDVTLTGTANWNGSDTGNATLRALGTSESRLDLVLSEGTRTEIRDAQTGSPLGQWTVANNSGNFAFHNCWTDAVWFFPALGSLSNGPGVVLSYIGQETLNQAPVQHIQAYTYQAAQPPGINIQQLSTMDIYLDSVSFLPVAIRFNAHPDNDATTNLLFEVDFSNYQSIGSIQVPMRIQRYQQGNLVLDFTVTGASVNSGLILSIFAIN